MRGDFIKNLFRQVPYLLLLTAIWLVLNEELSLRQVVIGFLLSIIVLWFTNKQLLLRDYSLVYRIRPWVWLRYISVVIFRIYKSGLVAIARIIKGDDSVCVTEYHSELDNELALMLLGNAITLTPGTVTIDVQGKTLLVLHFSHPLGQKPVVIDQPIRSIERIILEK